MDPATIVTAISAAAAGIDLINKIADQVVPFLTGGQPISKEHRMHIEGTSTEIVAREHGHTVKTITGEDLKDLPEELGEHIAVYESSARKNYELWKAIYPKRNDSADPVANAKVDQQLRQIVSDMSDDLDGILGFLESSGLYLDDHYLQFRDAIKRSGS